jgi:hypothetical protein
MLGVPLFRRSSVTIDCDQCGRRFVAATGGVCDRCRRILCPEHLHGSWVRRLGVELGARPVCTRCREARGAPAEAGGTSHRAIGGS